MAIITCTQHQVCPDECANCGFGLHTTRRGGFPGPHGQYCTEECAANAQAHADRIERAHHLNVRDLMCACPQVCAPAGHPTPAEQEEWRTYQAGRP